MIERGDSELQAGEFDQIHSQSPFVARRCRAHGAAIGFGSDGRGEEELIDCDERERLDAQKRYDLATQSSRKHAMSLNRFRDRTGLTNRIGHGSVNSAAQTLKAAELCVWSQGAD